MTVSVQWLFLMVPLVGLQCVSVVFPDHIFLFFKLKYVFACYAEVPIFCVCDLFLSIFA